MISSKKYAVLGTHTRIRSPDRPFPQETDFEPNTNGGRGRPLRVWGPNAAYFLNWGRPSQGSTSYLVESKLVADTDVEVSTM